MLRMGGASKILKAGGTRLFFHSCNVPLLVVLNTLLLAYIALIVTTSSWHRHGESMSLVGSDIGTAKDSNGEYISCHAF
jgi:hypothetical protein